MIKIYGAASSLGVALFDLDSKELMYGEICTSVRAKDLIVNFPQHDIQIFCEREWRDDLQELLYLLPHLEGTAEIHVKPKIDVNKMLANAGKKETKYNFLLIYISIGIMIGSLFMVPSAMEYRNSVLTQAQSIQSFTEEFAASKPEKEKVEQLYVSLNKLYSKVRVESVNYSVGSFTIIFTSANDNITLESLAGFEDSTLTKISVLNDDKGSTVHLYELEGML